MPVTIKRLNDKQDRPIRFRYELPALLRPYRNLIGNRRTYYAENLDDSYTKSEDERTEVPEGEANLVSSSEIGTDKHLPVIDLDFPCNLIPSSTPGHSHLYLDRAITWRAYKRLLAELYKTGIIERGFYNLSVERGTSFVRHPNHPKGQGN